jgi:hypothetical protein
MLEYGGTVFHYPLNDSTEDVEARTVRLNNEDYIAVKGAFHGKSQLILIGYDYNYKVLLDITANQITLSDRIEAVTTKPDMLGRERRDVYTAGSGGVSVHSSFTYGRSLQYNNRLFPYLLIEAIGAKDIENAKSYLTPDIRDNAAEIADYLGSFNSAEFPKHGEHPENVIAVRYDNGTVRLYSLDFDGELISNISEYAY